MFYWNQMKINLSRYITVKKSFPHVFIFITCDKGKPTQLPTKLIMPWTSYHGKALDGPKFY